MATNGYVQVTVPGGKSFLTFSWTRTSYSIQDNTSTIKWEMKHVSNNSAYAGYPDKTYAVIVNGTKYTGVAHTALAKGETKTLATGTTVIPHNADGTKTFAFGFSQSFQTEVVTGSGTGVLDPILQKATITSVLNFSDTQNPVIYYSNPAGSSVTTLQACIATVPAVEGEYSTPIISYRDIDKTGSSYTFNLTNAERAALRKHVTSGYEAMVRFYIKSVIDGTEYTSYRPAKFFLVNYEPFLAPEVWVTDARTKELTADSSGSTIIRYYSDVAFETYAAARKEATIRRQQVICGGETKTAYSSTFEDNTIENVESNTFYFSVTDNRGNTTKDAVVFSIDDGNFIEYIKPTCAIVATHLDANGNLTVDIEGIYYNGMFSKSIGNTFEIDYAYRENGGDISDWTYLSMSDLSNFTIDKEGNYTASFVINGLNYQSQYEVEVYLVDELMNSQTASTVIASIPLFDWGKDDFKHNTDVIMEHTKNIVGTRADGSTFRAIEPCNGSGNTVLNWDSYDQNASDTEIFGKDVKLHSKGGVYINGRQYGANKVLWSGASHMNGSQSITLSESVGAQPNGIVLVFSYYESSTSRAQDIGWSTHFVPKQQVMYSKANFSAQTGGQSFLMGLNAGFSLIGAKYLFIENTRIGGHSGNTSTGTNSGITFANNEFVLRYVIGV